MNVAIHPGIPTTYRGITFRSRLEATWACFFDLAGWPWEYEPFDLEGYIPDFVLRLHAPLLVEVKPASSLEDLRLFVPKIERSGWDGEALIVGAGPLGERDASPVVGLLAERAEEPSGIGWEWGPGRLFACLSCGSLSVLHEDMAWRCRVCGHGEGNGHIGEARDVVEREWSLAKNRVQWRAQ